MYNTIIFDVDGTLIDTENAVIGSLQTILEIDHGIKYEAQELYFVLGIPGVYSLKQLGVQDIPKSSIYIGDNVYDYECARDAGVDFGLALWGCKDHGNIPAKYKFEQPNAMIRIITN